MNDLNKIVWLYRSFKKYDKYTYNDIINIILPSYNLEQYQLHYDNKELIGFTNWAYLNDVIEERFMTSGKLKSNQWNCGENLWHIETLAKRNLKEIMNWTKDYFTYIFGYNKPIKWIRVKEDKIVKHQVRYTKPSWVNGVHV